MIKINETGHIRSSNTAMLSVVSLTSSHLPTRVAWNNGSSFCSDASFILNSVPIWRFVRPLKFLAQRGAWTIGGVCLVFQAKGVKLKHCQTCVEETHSNKYTSFCFLLIFQICYVECKVFPCRPVRSRQRMCFSFPHSVKLLQYFISCCLGGIMGSVLAIGPKV